MMENKQLALLYLIKNLSKKCINGIEGRKKLMKMMFFIEHLDENLKKLTPEKLIGNNFIIYKYGPFSFEVMDDFSLLKSKNLINESGFSISITKDGDRLIENEENKLPVEIRNKVNKIIENFCKYSGWDLENKSLSLLNIKREEKSSYFGNPVSVIITENK